MRLHVSENIRSLRKEHSMTQEQLAEAIGVTFAAVSKWERGAAAPDLDYIVEMADLFEVSVDALLGYQYRNNDRENIIKRLTEYRHNTYDKHLTDEERFMDAEKALKKYPNNFEVVNACAMLYEIRGIEKRDKKLLRRALKLAEQSYLLIDQNKDDDISALSIHKDMAVICSYLEETDDAVRILKEDNPCGINNAGIGQILAWSKEHIDEAPLYLSKALLNCIVEQITIVDGYMNVFFEKEDWQSASDIMKWLLGTFAALKRSDKPSFLNKAEASSLAYYGEVCLKLGRRDEAYDVLKRARKNAMEFDANPGYSAGNIRFVDLDRPYTGHDSLGATAMEGIKNLINQLNSPEIEAIWEEIQYE